MDKFIFPNKEKSTILALGAESAGNFSVYKKNHPYPSRPFKGRDVSSSEIERVVGQIHFSQDFGDLIEEKNWKKYQSSVLQYLKENKIKPDVVLTDLHPLLKTTLWGKDLAKKFGAKFVQIQHHHAHIFSAIGDKIINSKSYKLQATSYCIAMDGTGFGTDEKIWGGEAFAISNFQFPISNKNSKIKRIGHLENQILIGGELAIHEPARMLIGILNKVLSNSPSPFGRGCRVLATGEGKGEIQHKKIIYTLVKKHYTKNQFELLYNQLEQNFNCVETSSTGRILDAVSVLLEFCGNERKFKHEPIYLLEKNSTKPYSNLKPKIEISKNNYILNTTYLFEYLIKNIKKDKKRLAATAQQYIAEGLYKIIKLKAKSQKPKAIFISGGLANNKIISKYLISQGAYASKNIYPVKSGKIFNGVPLGDAGISFGQIVYYLLFFD